MELGGSHSDGKFTFEFLRVATCDLFEFSICKVLHGWLIDRNDPPPFFLAGILILPALFFLCWDSSGSVLARSLMKCGDI